jgi:inosine-uridine nucleoside N-ribohydrolase
MAMPDPRKIVIDLDPCIGSAVAAIVAMLDPKLDVVAITTTRGAASWEAAERFATALIAAIDPPKWPRVGFADRSRDWVERPDCVPVRDFELLNGEFGLGDSRPEAASPHHRKESSRLIIDSVCTDKDEVTVVTLGTLENVAACQVDPEFIEHVAGLVCLVGSVAVGGDATAAAEQNAFLNPDAARTVLRMPVTRLIVPLDVSQQPQFTLKQLEKFDARTGQAWSFVADLLKSAFRGQRRRFGEEGVRIHELAAIAAISEPKLFEMRRWHVDVELQGEITRGATVFDRRRRMDTSESWEFGTPVHVATEVDAQGVIDYAMRVLGDAG